MTRRTVRGRTHHRGVQLGRPRGFLIASAVLASALAPALAGAAIDDTLLVNRVSGLPGVAAKGNTGPGPAVSTDGRFVAFSSSADNLSADDNDSVRNVYLRDTRPAAGDPTTTLISRASGVNGAVADGGSYTPAISDDGRFVAFTSMATNLSGEDVDATRDVFVRDTQTNTTTLVSRAGGVAGVAGAADSLHPSISASGMQVAFQSSADNLSPDDTDGTSDIFVRDTAAGTTTLASRAHGTNGAAGNGDSYLPSISANGQRVAFESDADNLSSDDNDGVRNIFVREPRFRSTWHASRTTSVGLISEAADGNSRGADLSADGSVVVFTSPAGNLINANPSPGGRIFKRRIAEEETTLVSRADGADGAPAEGASFDSEVSGDGRYVAYVSSADNLSDQDGPGYDIFARDTQDQRTALVSRASGPTGAGALDRSLSPAISGNGLFVAFLSDADNLTAADDDSFINLFMRELAPGLPPPVVLPDLGSNDHGQHDGSGAAGHSAAGHPQGGHAGAGSGHAHTPPGTRLSGGILFASRKQDIDELFVFVTIHEHGKIRLEGQVRVPGGAARGSYRFKAVRRTLEPHLLRKVRLILPRRALRAVKRAMRSRRLVARIKLTAVGDSGKRQIARRTIRIKP